MLLHVTVIVSITGVVTGTAESLACGITGNAGGCMDTGAGVAHPNSQSQQRVSDVNMTVNCGVIFMCKWRAVSVGFHGRKVITVSFC